MSTKNFRHGKIRIQSGDVVPLEKNAEFTEGDFSWSFSKDIKQILDRGKLKELRKGDEQAVEWSFSAKFVDKTLYRTLDQAIFDGHTETITGLVGGALNDPVSTTYPYEQNSFTIDDAGFTKLAIDAVPAVDGDYSEDTGAIDREDAIVASTFQVLMPAADTDLEVTYDAVGGSTRDLELGACGDDVKTLAIFLDIYDPCDPNAVVETYELRHAAVNEISFEEGDDFDTLSFSGFALIRRPIVTP